MNPYGRVNSSSNHCRSSSNAVAYLFYHQCCGTLSLFGVDCTAAANALDSRFFLQLALDWDCMSDSCLKVSARTCWLAVRLKLISLACLFDCAILLRILLLTLIVLRFLASKISYARFWEIQQLSYLLHYTWGHQVDLPPHLFIHLHRPPPPLLPWSHH